MWRWSGRSTKRSNVEIFAFFAAELASPENTSGQIAIRLTRTTIEAGFLVFTDDYAIIVKVMHGWVISIQCLNPGMLVPESPAMLVTDVSQR
ncbi:hypothetical protein HFO63_00490 [Rhizobium laguerreae]|uniref:hypothetical protein n=1 Tax=Rhizobium laguerreae TaxID=1076926 RepID=UPI001C8FE435|nr:hypothetical protein [Rhizobium laguerreae]MBY3144086.1 hypothetical protein [Rhizobium laguerreae]